MSLSLSYFCQTRSKAFFFCSLPDTTRLVGPISSISNCCLNSFSLIKMWTNLYRWKFIPIRVCNWLWYLSTTNPCIFIYWSVPTTLLHQSLNVLFQIAKHLFLFVLTGQVKTCHEHRYFLYMIGCKLTFPVIVGTHWPSVYCVVFCALLLYPVLR